MKSMNSMTKAELIALATAQQQQITACLLRIDAMQNAKAAEPAPASKGSKVFEVLSEANDFLAAKRREAGEAARKLAMDTGKCVKAKMPSFTKVDGGFQVTW